jgi:hypothetical protein
MENKLSRRRPSAGTRVSAATLRAIQHKLRALASDPEGSSAEARTWFMLLVEQQKVDLARERAVRGETAPPPLSPQEQRECVWRTLGYSEEEKARLRSECAGEFDDLLDT